MEDYQGSPVSLTMPTSQKEYSFDGVLLHLACYLGSFELINILVKDPSTKLSVEIQDNAGNNPIHYVARNGELKIITPLLDILTFDSLDQKNHEGKTPIEVALDAGHHSVAAILGAKKVALGSEKIG